MACVSIMRAFLAVMLCACAVACVAFAPCVINVPVVPLIMFRYAGFIELILSTKRDS